MPPKKRVAERDDDTKTPATRVQTRDTRDVITGRRVRSGPSLSTGEGAAIVVSDITSTSSHPLKGFTSIIRDYADQRVFYTIEERVSTAHLENANHALAQLVPDENEHGRVTHTNLRPDRETVEVERTLVLVYTIEMVLAEDDHERKTVRARVHFDARRPHPVFGNAMTLDFHYISRSNEELIFIALDHYADGGHVVVATLNRYGPRVALNAVSKEILRGVVVRIDGDERALARELPLGKTSGIDCLYTATPFVKIVDATGWAARYRPSVFMTDLFRVHYGLSDHSRTFKTGFAVRRGDVVILREHPNNGDRAPRVELSLEGDRVRLRLFASQWKRDGSWSEQPDPLALDALLDVPVARYLSCVRAALADAAEYEHENFFALLQNK